MNYRTREIALHFRAARIIHYSIGPISRRLLRRLEHFPHLCDALTSERRNATPLTRASKRDFICLGSTLSPADRALRADGYNLRYHGRFGPLTQPISQHVLDGNERVVSEGVRPMHQCSRAWRPAVEALENLSHQLAEPVGVNALHLWPLVRQAAHRASLLERHCSNPTPR